MPTPPPLHLGGLHPFEQLVVLAIAIGPFVVLCVVVWFRRRQDLADERAAAAVDPDTPLDRE